MKEEEEKMVKKMEKGETIKTRYGKGYSWNFPENSKPTLWKTIEEKLRVKKFIKNQLYGGRLKELKLPKPKTIKYMIFLLLNNFFNFFF